MSFIASALIIGGIGAAATIYSGSQAAGAVRGAANTAAGEQQAALNQQATLSAPYRALGESAIPTLQGLVTPGSQQSTLESTPGYQFTKQQGMESVTNAASAMGLTLSGNTLEGLDKFTAGLADQTFQQQFQDVSQVVGMGQAAAAGQAQNVGQAATNMGNIAIGAGTNIANIDMNTIAGVTKGIGNAFDTAVMANTLQNLGG